MTKIDRTPKLTEEQRLFVVRELACFATPSEAAAAVKETFGIEMTRQAIARYDPTKYEDTAAKWEPIFEATREAFIAETAEIGIAHKSYRLQQLQRLYQRAKRKDETLPLAVQILDQAARETREHSGAASLSIGVGAKAVSGEPLDPDEARAFLQLEMRVGGEE